MDGSRVLLVDRMTQSCDMGLCTRRLMEKGVIGVNWMDGGMMDK